FQGTVSQKLAQELAYTKWNLGRARLMADYHRQINEGAYRASRMRPEAVRVWGWLAEHFRENAKQAATEEARSVFQVKSQQYAEGAQRLSEMAIVVPVDYDKIKKYLEEHVWLLEESAKAIEIEQQFATEPVTLLDYRASFKGYLRHFQHWRDEQFEPWHDE